MDDLEYPPSDDEETSYYLVEEISSVQYSFEFVQSFDAIHELLLL